MQRLNGTLRNVATNVWLAAAAVIHNTEAFWLEAMQCPMDLIDQSFCGLGTSSRGPIRDWHEPDS